jgi:hypothetical protein
LQYIANLGTSTVEGQKHNLTMVSNGSPGTATHKMNESFVHMAHVSSYRACAQDGYLKSFHWTIIDGDMRWVSGWFFGWFWSLGTLDTQLARPNLGKKTHSNHGSRRCPMATMVPSPRHCHIQHLANMLRNKSVLLKLDNIIVVTMYLLAILRHNASSMRRA